MSKKFNVKIKSCSNPAWWYYDYIGKTVLVEDADYKDVAGNNFRGFRCVDSKIAGIGHYYHYYISKSDCDIVVDVVEDKLTIKEGKYYITKSGVILKSINNDGCLFEIIEGKLKYKDLVYHHSDKCWYLSNGRAGDFGSENDIEKEIDYQEELTPDDITTYNVGDKVMLCKRHTEYSPDQLIGDVGIINEEDSKDPYIKWEIHRGDDTMLGRSMSSKNLKLVERATEPKEETFKVRIIKSNNFIWYHNHIGEIFEVKNRNNDPECYEVIHTKYPNRGINKSDCIKEGEEPKFSVGDYVKIVYVDKGDAVFNLTIGDVGKVLNNNRLDSVKVRFKTLEFNYTIYNWQLKKTTKPKEETFKSDSEIVIKLTPQIKPIKKRIYLRTDN